MSTVNWLRADEERPEELQTVLVYTSGGTLTLGTIYEGRWEIDFSRWDGLGSEEPLSADVQWWAYLPGPPPEDDAAAGRE